MRESNFELLRIIAMFMVLVIHANFVSLPRPMATELITDPVASGFRYMTESLGIVGVNVFVLISGWFRIKTDVRRVLKFVFQILFFWVGGYVVCMLVGDVKLSWRGISECFAFSRWDWFIKSYAFLFIIAPVLNAFVDQASKRQLLSVVIAFFLFQSTYGWIGGASRFFVRGYGPLSFIGLYLLAQYVRSFSEQGKNTLFVFSKQLDILFYFILCIINTVFALIIVKSYPSYYNLCFAYCNPIIVMASLYLLLFFSKLKIKQSRFINWLGASCFAVYLLHSQINIRDVFNSIVVYLDASFRGVIAICLIFLFLVLVFVVSVLADQIRIILWNRISRVCLSK